MKSIEAFRKEEIAQNSSLKNILSWFQFVGGNKEE
jgi:hypothetical protein